ncbi:hypothetical protein [Clostridium argentinense]|uniref:hypothetical protein n=1 Tax=Clostridium argentinense TaxID=29341 RepID=UPI000A742DAD|nr:hypothetical protein [Clostridium argentinense]
MERKIEVTELVVIFFTITWLGRTCFSRAGLLDLIGIPIMLLATIMIFTKWFKR